jgi:hypothetical protein
MLYQLMTMLKGIIRHFSKSSYSTAMLQKEHNLAGDDEPVKALQKIRKTWFGMHWMACTSLDPCLPSIRSLVIAKTIKFKVCIHLVPLKYLGISVVTRVPRSRACS